MEHIIKQLKKGAKHTRLSIAEKAEMKSALLSYVHTNPAQGLVTSTPSPFFSPSYFRNKKSLSAVVLGGLLLGSSVSFAAENTVPGDLLYPIKRQVNERVRGAVAITPEAQAVWEVELVNRRLQELEKITTRQDIKPEIQRGAEEAVVESLSRAKQSIEKVETAGHPDEVVVIKGALDAILSTHKQKVEADSNLELVQENTQSGDERSFEKTLERMKDNNVGQFTRMMNSSDLRQEEQKGMIKELKKESSLTTQNEPMFQEEISATLKTTIEKEEEGRASVSPITEKEKAIQKENSGEGKVKEQD